MTPIRPFVIGLTGSIGMGKTTTAQMFADRGIPVWGADQAVARLYAKGGGAVQAIFDLVPGVVENGSVSKQKLRDWIAVDDFALGQIEAVVHPLVAADRAEFLAKSGADIVVLDIPLLFETGADEEMDMVVVVSAGPAENIQRDRVLARPDMTEDMFQSILKKQVPDHEKRIRADVVIPTLSLETARIAVDAVIGHIREILGDA